MTTLADLPAGHTPTATELATYKTFITRSIPLKGVRLTNSSGAIATTSGTTELDLSKFAFTGLTLVTNRYYLYVANITWTSTVTTDSWNFKLRANTATSGTQIGQTGFNPTQGSGGAESIYEFLFVGDSTYNSVYLSVQRGAGTGTLSYYGATSAGPPVLSRSWGRLYDLGDSDNWSDAP